LRGARLSFYIKPADGFKLPKIMQWIKQTFSVRFNIVTWRTGHVWGDRYRSEILVGEPPPGAGEVDGGDTFLQRGAFFSAAPWRIFQAMPQAQQKVVPVSGTVVGRGVGGEKAKTKIPVAKTYKLAWVSPRRAGGTVKVRFSCGHQNGPRTRQSTRLTAPSPRAKRQWTASKTTVPKKPRGKSVPHPSADQHPLLVRNGRAAQPISNDRSVRDGTLSWWRTASRAIGRPQVRNPRDSIPSFVVLLWCFVGVLESGGLRKGRPAKESGTKRNDP
jgi:hypothetical protein